MHTDLGAGILTSLPFGPQGVDLLLGVVWLHHHGGVVELGAAIGGKLSVLAAIRLLQQLYLAGEPARLSWHIFGRVRVPHLSVILGHGEVSTFVCRLLHEELSVAVS